MHTATRRRSSASASPMAAPQLDVDDLVREILLRLPPHPSSLPRASLVCKRWRRLVSDPAFLRLFRAHHGKSPLLGMFFNSFGGSGFGSTLQPPDRIPAARFSMPHCRDERWLFCGCRHGLAALYSLARLEAVVSDPLTGRQRCVAFPPGFDSDGAAVVRSVAVLCAAGDAGHVHGDCYSSPYKLVVLRCDWYYTRAFACLYESESGVWGNTVSVTMADDIGKVMHDYAIGMGAASILVGNTLCWLLGGGGVLEFDLERQSLAVIEKLADHLVAKGRSFQILRTEDSNLGLAVLSELSIQLWERKSNCDGVITWVLQKTIQLDRLFPLKSKEEEFICIVGYVEEHSAILLWKDNHVLMIQLASVLCKKLFQCDIIQTYFPYTNFYAAGREIGGGDDESEALNNA